MKRRIILLLASLLSLSPGHAAGQSNPPKENRVFVYGVGTTSCGKFVEDIKQPNGWVIYSSWLNGYLTAVNIYDDSSPQSEGRKDVQQKHEPESLILWIAKYCQDNPLSTVMDATRRLALDLARVNR
jgi:hypothetical protein